MSAQHTDRELLELAAMYLAGATSKPMQPKSLRNPDHAYTSPLR